MSLFPSRSEAMPSLASMPLDLPCSSSDSQTLEMASPRPGQGGVGEEGYPSVPFPAQGSTNLGSILTPKSSEAQILPRRKR